MKLQNCNILRTKCASQETLRKHQVVRFFDESTKKSVTNISAISNVKQHQQNKRSGLYEKTSLLRSKCVKLSHVK